MSGVVTASAADVASGLPGLWNLAPIPALIGVLILLYWLIATGRLIPRSTHQTIVAAERKRGDEWKETALSKDAVNAELLAQNGKLVEGNRVTAAFLRAAAPGSGEATQGGG